MGLFEHFPYTNFHELNADWLLRKTKELLQRMTAAEARLDAAEARLDAAEGRLDVLEADVANIKAEIVVIKQRITSLESRMTQAETDIDALEARMDQAETDIEALEARVTQTEADISALEIRMTQAEADIDANEAAISALQTRIAQLEALLPIYIMYDKNNPPEPADYAVILATTNRPVYLRYVETSDAATGSVYYFDCPLCRINAQENLTIKSLTFFDPDGIVSEDITNHGITGPSLVQAIRRASGLRWQSELICYPDTAGEGGKSLKVTADGLDVEWVQ